MYICRHSRAAVHCRNITSLQFRGPNCKYLKCLTFHGVRGVPPVRHLRQMSEIPNVNSL